jgi:protein-disulfide isomerase
MAKDPQASKNAPATPGTNTGQGKPSGATKTTTATSSRAVARGSKRRRVKSNSNRTLVWLIIGGVVVIFAGIVLLNWQSLFGTQATASPQVSEGTSWGPASAPVKIVEYSNFGCSHCKNFAENNGKTLRQEYEAGGKVRFEFRQFKLADQGATEAANASLCAADQNRFWNYHDILFARQGTSADPFSKANLQQYGKELGLDSATFDPCVINDKFMDAVNQNSQEGSSQGVEGTPTFFVNGKMLVGDVPYEELKGAVDAALQSANAG